MRRQVSFEVGDCKWIAGHKHCAKHCANYILETHLGAILTSLPNSTSFWQATDVRSEVGDGGLEKQEGMVDCGQNCSMGCI